MTDDPAADLTRLCERLAARFAADGLAHPVAAAAAAAARGAHGLTVAQYAQLLGLTPDTLHQAEAGTIAWARLPPELGADLSTNGGVDLLALADLAAHYDTEPDARAR